MSKEKDIEVYTETTKRCPTCKQVKPHSEYCRDKRRKYGISVYCKDCSNERIKMVSAVTERYRRYKHDEKKKKATTVIANLVRKGILKKEPCFLCGESKVQGHHLNYDYPDKVVWLCVTHHAGVHYK